MNSKTAITRYIVDLNRVSEQRIVIQLILQKTDQKGQTFKLPAWIPGSYLIRDFAKNIVDITASAAGKPLLINKIDKLTWRCEPCDAPLQITYEVQASDLSVRGAHADGSHAYFNGTAVFLMPEQHRQGRFSVEILEKSCPIHEARVISALTESDVNASGFGIYYANSYDELIDHPFEVGQITREVFTATVPHSLNFFGRFKTDVKRIREDVAKICATTQALFHSPAPMTHYDFLITVLDKGYGGLEHENCSSLICSHYDLPFPHDKGISPDYEKFLGLISHEYFHAWLVKRIKPDVFMPYPLWHETYTELLWVFEGFTAYYDDLILLRAGLLPLPRYLTLIEKQLTQYEQTPGRFKQSLNESSFDAWIKFYQPNESSVNTGVSYYQKGSLLALCLDVAIRRETADTRSLDDLLRLMWQHHGVKKQGLRFDLLLADLKTILPAWSTLPARLQTWVAETTPLPIEESLQALGVTLARQPMLPEHDAHFVPAWGVKLMPDGLKIQSVLEGGIAFKAGLLPGDELLAIDEFQIDKAKLSVLMGRYAEGEKMLVHFFRRGLLHAINLSKAAPAFSSIKLGLSEDTAQEVQARLKQFQGI